GPREVAWIARAMMAMTGKTKGTRIRTHTKSIARLNREKHQGLRSRAGSWSSRFRAKRVASVELTMPRLKECVSVPVRFGRRRPPARFHLHSYQGRWAAKGNGNMNPRHLGNLRADNGISRRRRSAGAVE